MQGGISPLRPCASMSKATTKRGFGSSLEHVTPRQVHMSSEVLFHVVRAPPSGLERCDLMQSRASRWLLSDSSAIANAVRETSIATTAMCIAAHTIFAGVYFGQYGFSF
ncbi:Os10g0360900 [Oryza sativa Japonica Group]|uniref:Os10g0360900 protein n=1 Tax=Oryza sativa subsp. japonica TaxID=39947 RepID=A0A0P0XU46_ORYSJ|nr:hypothetical protein EE612_050893 [Oryza sativa]BAT10499.1 Os10g0360900 [Oryza sativa Japonica Group]